MLKIFRDKDNIGFIGDRVKSSKHSHCVIQAFFGLGEPLSMTVGNERVCGKCIIVNKNIEHDFSCDGNMRLSILIDPSSNFANALNKKIDGDHLVCDKDGIKRLQGEAISLVDTADSRRYAEFVRDFAEYIGVERKEKISDERIAQLLELLNDCDCYDHTVESFADKIALSSSRLSHLFREQIGVPLKSYILFHQLEKAFTAILCGHSITDAAMAAGFDSPSHFAATVKKWMGLSTSSVKDSEFLKVLM